MPCDYGALTAHINQVFSANQELLYGPIVRALTADAPYLAVLPKGTFPAQTAQTLLTVLQGRTKMAQNMAAPSFTSMFGKCGSASMVSDKNGTNQYPYRVDIGEGESDVICLNQAFSAFKESLMAMLSAYQEGVTQLISADTRWQLFQQAGVVAIVQTATTAANMMTGGENQVGIVAGGGLPAIESDGPLDVTTLNAFNRRMRSVLRVKPFGSGNAQNARLLAGPDTLENLRNDMGGAAAGNALIMPLGALAAGGDNVGTNGLKGYLFDQLMRGIQYGEDQIPLRLNWNGAGYDPVDPDVSASATEGTVAETSSDWEAASHEVSFLFYQDSFQRQTPEQWTGEGKVRFDRQLYGGEITFINNKDMACNKRGDWGVLSYLVGRALKPMRPWSVLPIIHKRCLEPQTVSECTGVSG